MHSKLEQVSSELKESRNSQPEASYNDSEPQPERHGCVKQLWYCTVLYSTEVYRNESPQDLATSTNHHTRTAPLEVGIVTTVA